MADIKPNKSGFIEADGFKIYYEYFGEGKKETFCLMNGVAMFTKSWYNFLPMIYPEYDVILYDFLGQGQSSSPDEPYSIERFCDYLTMIMQEVNVDKIHLMGISYGALVAADFARMHQDKLLTLTLSGGLLTHSENFDYGIEVGKYILNEGRLDIWGKSLYSAIFSDGFMKNFRHMFDEMQKRFMDRYKDRVHSLIRLLDTQLDFINNVEENRKAYENIKTPTLILTGEKDVALPVWIQKHMKEILPNSKMIIVEDCGHVVYIEKAQFFFENMKKLAAAKSVDY
jgi:pimeloyl-ACP methyl ester carboxylesterase